MANASYIQDSFAGGEKSQLAQGRITDRDYRTWMNVCLNGHPTESGAWVRRPGTMYAGHTRGGKVGRVYRWDFATATPYTLEFTEGFIRFRQGIRLAATNDAQNVVAISGANPAVVQTAAAVTWVTGNTLMIAGGPALTQNRQFVATRVDSTHFSIADALTGATIDGSTLGSLPAGAMVSRVQEVASPYISGSWASLRAVQAETSAVLLQAIFPPQLLNVTTSPGPGVDAQFSLAAVTFLDGPYLDPFTNGVQAVPSGLSGNITLTLQFPTYSATQAYQKGSFVTSSSVNYQSLIDDNVGNTPVSSPSAWVAVSAGAAINNGQGFLSTDVGRLVRLFSEPALWTSAATYSIGNTVSYNPTGLPGAATYWISLTNTNTGHVPGTDITNWQLVPANAAIWSWGKITSLANLISATLSGSVNVGTLTGGGGVAAAFDSNTSKIATASAQHAYSNTASSDDYVGKNYTGASAQTIGYATLYPSTDQGFVFVSSTNAGPGQATVTISLRAKSTAPASPSDGTLLGSFPSYNLVLPVPAGSPPGTVGAPNPQNFQAVTIQSNNTVSTWNYVWFEVVVAGASSGGGPVAQTLSIAAAQAQFFKPPGTGSGNAVNIEVIGPPLLYTNACISWRLGIYSNTTGWPTCGCYHEGRIWLAGAIDNRFDASVSNGLVGTTLNMAPTDQNGVVGAANGITGVVNSDGVNPIFWLMPDLQGIIMGSQGGEWLISGSVSGAITPTNIQAPRVTRIGCANVEPRRTDHTTVFVQRYARKVCEYFTDVYSGKFAAPNLAKDTLHITKPFVGELAWQQATIPILWGRNNDGSWWGTTYKRDTLATATGPTLNGWHRHQLGSGRSVVSIAIGPSVGGALDALTMVTLDAASGVYHAEVLTDAVDEGNTLLQASYVDDAINPTSTSTSNSTPSPYGGLTLNGLWHLNGKTVTAWLGGLDCGDYAVANGSITVPYGDGVSAGTAAGLFTATYAAALPLSQMLVGFTFASQGQIVRPALPAESGARNGPAVGKKRRTQKIAAQLEGAGVGVSFGTLFAPASRLNPAKFRQPNDVAFLVNQQFTGVYKDTLTDDYSYDGMICWQVARPYPLNIANIGGFIEATDE
jgi:hypothetical protein